MCGRETVSLHCPNCHRSFRVLEDEQFDHDCPHCCGIENVVAQPEHFGIDVQGNEVLVGDSIVLLPDGEMILEENLEDYLIEELGFEFKTAE